MNELYIDIHSLFCRIDHYRVLSRVPCAIQFFSYMLSCFSCVQLSANPWTVARQSPLSMGFSSQEYWSGLPCPPPGDLPGPEIEPVSLTPPAVADRFFTTSMNASPITTTLFCYLLGGDFLNMTLKAKAT